MSKRLASAEKDFSVHEGLALMRLMHLSSVSLPVGGYSFSHGLEYAIDAGWLKNADQIEQWVVQQLMHGLARVDLPVLFKVMTSLKNTEVRPLRGDLSKAPAPQGMLRLNDLVLACRESKELRYTDTAMGAALARLLPTLGLPLPELDEDPKRDWSFAVLFAWACHAWEIEPEKALYGFAWSWLENQVAAATKLVPLGQTQAQALLASCQYCVPQAVGLALNLKENDIGASLPALAAASARHETLYTRLFRS